MARTDDEYDYLFKGTWDLLAVCCLSWCGHVWCAIVLLLCVAA